MNRPTIPAPHRHDDDLRAYAWSNRLAGFGIGVIVASIGWFILLWNFSP